ncbi:MAG: biopolymer transporter ExbD [Kiritimatiellae bacterium]|nr:biopolymer transporter ExbD [Kiritimatiellia bacterium]
MPDRRTALTSVKQISEINLTPLMDLTFILLITFIITFPLIEQGIPVNLPRGEAEEMDPLRSRTITVDRRGRVYLDDVPVTTERLAGEMKVLGKSDPGATVLVRADASIPYGDLMKILQILHRAGLSRVALVTQSGGAP